MTLLHAVIAIVLTAIVSGALGYAFRGPESDLIEQGKQEAYEEMARIKKFGQKL